jgi:chorismate mutase
MMQTEHSFDLIGAEVELELLDLELVRLVRLRRDLAIQITTARCAVGMPGFNHDAEYAVIERYRPLGTAGIELASLLLRMTR